MMRRRCSPAPRCSRPPRSTTALRAGRRSSAPFEVLEFDWADAKRQRAVPVRLYLPQAPAPTQPCRWWCSRTASAARAAATATSASTGRATASPACTCSTSAATAACGCGNPFGLVGRLQDAAQEREAIAAVHDLSFALDQLLAARPGRAHRPRAHRRRRPLYGANTTLLAAGARVAARWPALDAARPARCGRHRAVGAAVLRRERAAGDPAGRAVPSLHVTATDDIIRIPGYYSRAEDRVAVYDATGGTRKALAVFEGGSHSMFTDRAGTGGAS